MTRIEIILKQVRRVLGDTNKDRWSDTDLLDLVDEAQKDIAKQTDILRDIITILLNADQHTYDLPMDTLDVLRVIHDKEAIPLKTNAYMDQYGLTGRVLSSIPNVQYSTRVSNQANTQWQSTVTEGDIVCIIFDKLNRRKIRVWPIPTGDTFTIDTDLVDLLGVTTELGGQILDPYGLVSSIIDPQETIIYPEGVYGVLTEIISARGITIYRSKSPATLEFVTSDLEVDDFCDVAIKYYVIGEAFKDDIKETNRKVGHENSGRYQRELDQITAISSSDSISIDHRDTTYNALG